MDGTIQLSPAEISGFVFLLAFVCLVLGLWLGAMAVNPADTDPVACIDPHPETDADEEDEHGLAYLADYRPHAVLTGWDAIPPERRS